MRYSFISLLAVVSSVFCVSGFGQQPYNLANNASTLYKDRNGVALNNQNPTTPGNGQGQIIQLGYFTLATDTSLFAGVFRPLAQFNSGDSATGTTAVSDGRVALRTEFDTTNVATNFAGSATSFSYAAFNIYPATGAPLAIRWFDTTNTLGNYNSVSATNWDWIAPSLIPATSIQFSPADITTLGLAFQDPANPYIASIPEPSSYVMLGLGALALTGLLRRRPVSA